MTDWATGYVSGIATAVLCLLSGAAWQLARAEPRRAEDDPYRDANERAHHDSEDNA